MRISEVFRMLCFQGRRKAAQPREAKAGWPQIVGLSNRISNLAQVSHICNFGREKSKHKGCINEGGIPYFFKGGMQIYAGRLKISVISTLV